jgi:hypothetical protein
MYRDMIVVSITVTNCSPYVNHCTEPWHSKRYNYVCRHF